MSWSQTPPPPCPTESNPVTFSYALFTQTFPEFATVPQGVVLAYWTMAQNYLSNAPNSKVQDSSRGGQRAQLLNLITAHLLKLFGDASSGSGIVGRINSASEGSVSVQAEMPPNPDAGWFNQTPYGAAFWQATVGYRTARIYISAQRPYLGVSRGGWRPF